MEWGGVGEWGIPGVKQLKIAHMQFCFPAEDFQMDDRTGMCATKTETVSNRRPARREVQEHPPLIHLFLCLFVLHTC